MISRATLEALAPSELKGRRLSRYEGDGLSSPLGAFHDRDREELLSLYARLQVLHVILKALAARDVVTPAEVQALCRRPEWSEILRHAKQLGAAADYPVETRQTLHDVRGGSLLALLASIGLIEADETAANDVLQLFFYARDHLKIMRNCVPEIDPEAMRRDLAASLHSFDLIRQKWSRGAFAFGGVERQVVLDCAVKGPVAHRCLEFSALDRVLYNLMNNAARHGNGGPISLSIFTPGSEENPNVRFVVSNRISPDQQGEIERLTAGDPGRLLRGGLSTAGGGVGLQICAEFVRHAHGLASVDEVLREGFAGATLIQHQFVAWFHWPRTVEPAA